MKIVEGTIIERLVLKDGTIWLHVWRRELPGLLHLVWEQVKEVNPTIGI